MPLLEIRLLGPPQVRQGGDVAAGLRSDKVRALLAYLVVEADQPHRREKLAGLLWPDYPEESARASLRRALADLRLGIGDKEANPAFLEITRRTIQFNRASDAWVDVTAFDRLTQPLQPPNGGSTSSWEQAASLYQGEFLEGFSLPDSSAFDEWLLLTREQLQRQMLEILEHLAGVLRARGEYSRGLEFAWRGAKLDPLRESTLRELMQLLVLSGQRQAALAQYESYAANLQQELGIVPSTETQALVAQIRGDERPSAVSVDSEPAHRPSREIGACPYRGLAAFREQDAPFFFGRESFTRQSLSAIQKRPGAAVIIGPSGSGKSSTVFAGVIPYLRAKGSWQVAVLRPGADPFASLSAALLPLLEPEQSETSRLIESQQLAAALRTGDLSLQRVVERISEKNGSETSLLLFIDQFEELYTLSQQPQTQRRFLDGLLSVIDARPDMREHTFALLLTLRADFMGQALSYHLFADLLQRCSLLLGPMDRAQLRAAIEKPAGVQGAAFESGLVERILDDVGREPGNLPLLEFALTLLWEQAEAGLLTHTGYEHIGGVEGALARYAEQVFTELEPDDRQKAEQVFLQLIRPGEGTQDTRRVASRAEIGDQNWSLVQHLADKRLVVTGRDVSGMETVEVVHEALIGNWERLQNWIEAERAFRVWQERLRLAIRQWETTGRDEGALLRGAPLVEAERWLEDHAPDLSQAEVDFVRASVNLRERWQAEQERARRRIVVGLSAGLVITLFLAIFAITQWRQAGQQRNSAVQAQATAQAERDQTQYNLASLLAARAINLLGTENDLAILLSVESVRRVETMEGRSSLYTTLNATSRIKKFLNGHLDEVHALAYAPGGQILATGAKNGEIILWDISTGRERLRLPDGHTDQVNSLAFNMDGSLLVSAGFDDTVRLWELDAASPTFGQQIGPPLEGHMGNVWSVAFSPDGSLLASGDADGSILLWVLNDESGAYRRVTTQPIQDESGIITSLAFSPDGQFLASASSGGTLALWDIQAGGSLSKTLRSNAEFISKVAFSPDGRTLASAGRDDTIHLWDVDEASNSFGQPLGGPLIGHPDNIWDLAFSPAGDRLASGGDDGVVLLWDVNRSSGSFGRRLDTPLAGHDGPVYALAFSPDGATLATGGADDLVILWNMAADTPLVRELARLGTNGTIDWAAFNPGQNWMTEPPIAQRSLTIWDIDEASPSFGQPVGKPLVGHQLSINSAVFSPDGKLLASAGYDKTIRFWDVDPASTTFAQPIGSPIEGFAGTIFSVDFSPDGKLLASADYDRTIRLWNTDPDSAEFGQPVGLPLEYAEDTYCLILQFSPDGNTLAAGCVDGIRLWDLRSGAATFRRFVENAVQEWLVCGELWSLQFNLEFSPDGKTLAAGGCSSDIYIWNVEAGSASFGQQVGPPLQGHQAPIMDFAYSPSGRYLASGDKDGKVLVWDMLSKRAMELTTPGNQQESVLVPNVIFSPDGQSLTAVYRDGRILRWDFDLEAWITQACQRVNRSLTESEWRQFFGVEPYQATCPELSSDLVQ